MPELDDDLERMKPFGWSYDGTLHLLRGVELADIQGYAWRYTGRIVDADGNVLQEADETAEEEAGVEADDD